MWSITGLLKRWNFVCVEGDYDGRKTKERIITIELAVSKAGGKLRLFIIDKSQKIAMLQAGLQDCFPLPG